jgi:archaellum biogenesis protein FlaJ (TadC family)
MFEINEARNIFIFAVCASIFCLIYDFVMTKTGLYKKLLKKAPVMTESKYHSLRTASNIIAIVFVLVILKVIILNGIWTGNWLFVIYLSGTPLVFILPGWLIIRHLTKLNYERSKKKPSQL